MKTNTVAVDLSFVMQKINFVPRAVGPFNVGFHDDQGENIHHKYGFVIPSFHPPSENYPPIDKQGEKEFIAFVKAELVKAFVDFVQRAAITNGGHYAADDKSDWDIPGVLNAGIHPTIGMKTCLLMVQYQDKGKYDKIVSYKRESIVKAGIGYVPKDQQQGFVFKLKAMGLMRPGEDERLNPSIPSMTGGFTL